MFKKSLTILPWLLAILFTFSCAEKDPVAPDEDDDLTQFETYTLTYEGNGATGTPSAVGNLKKGAQVTLHAGTGMAKSGSFFAGWTNSAGTTFAGGSTYTMGSANVTLYAAWSAVPTYTLTYDGNGATGTPSPVTGLTSGLQILLNTGSGMSRLGYSFAGWTNSTGNSFGGGASYNMTNSDVTLYASWTALPSYTLTYDGNGATGTPSALTPVYNNQQLTLNDGTGMTRTYYDFMGWTNSAGTLFGGGTPYEMGGADVTLYAKWKVQYRYVASGTDKRFWSDSANWLGGTIPTFDNTADIIFDGNLGIIAETRISAGRTVKSITFGSTLNCGGATFDIRFVNNAGTPYYTLFLDGGVGRSAITVEAGHSITSQIRFGGNNVNEYLSLTTDLDLTVNHPTVPFRFDGRVFGPNAVIHKYGVGIASATRENGFAGIFIHEGVFHIFASANAPGKSNAVLTLGETGSAANATLAFGSTLTNKQSIVVNSGSGARVISNLVSAAGKPTLSGPLTLNGDVTFNTVAGSWDRIILSGTISGPGGIIKTGTGSLQLNGVNTYTGPTVVQTGSGSLSPTADAVKDSASVTLYGTGLWLGVAGIKMKHLSLNGGTTWLTNGTYNRAALSNHGPGTGIYGGNGSVNVTIGGAP